MFLNSDVRSKLSSFVTRRYAEWHSIQEKQKRHVGNSYHTDVMVKALEINDKFEKNCEHVSQYVNPQLVEILARIVHLLGKQGLAFRGHRESLVEEGNTGNFLEIDKEIANVLLKTH